MGAPVEIHGHCTPRFERVRDRFARSFESGELGAAVAVTLAGEVVLDLWGGWTDAARTRPWERDTLVNVYSTTKGVVAVCAHRLAEAGALDLDAPVARYWPEFAAAGKARLPVRWLLSHQVGLPALRDPVPAERRYDWTFMTDALARETPWWEPGTAHGYHARTFGYLAGEVIRRVDGRTVGAYLREELSDPLELDFHVGLPTELDGRCAEMLPAPAGPAGANPVAAALADPDSLPGKVFGNPPIGPDEVNTRAWRAAEIPAGNGHGTARGLARLYGALATGGTLDGFHVLGPQALERAVTEAAAGPDRVLHPLHTRFGLGFFLTQPMIPFGPNPRSFGHPGAGGSIAFADPDAGLGFAYVMNQMQLGLAGDARGFSLVHEVYAALA